jgi:hypothetical protein
LHNARLPIAPEIGFRLSSRIFARRGRPTPPLIHGTSAYRGGVLIECYTNFLRLGKGIVVGNWPCVTSIAGPHGDAQLSRAEGGPLEFGNQVLILSHRKPLSSKATVVNVAEKSGCELGRHG